MDLQMPVMEGIATSGKIRSLEGKLAQVQIISLIAKSFEDDRKMAKEAGIKDFISKSFDSAVLVATIAKYIR